MMNGHAERPQAPEDIVPSDIADTMSQAIEPAPLDAVDAAVMKSRLLARARESVQSDATTTIHPADGEWHKFGPRIKIKVLRREAETMSYLLKLDPGALLVPHHHRHDEECMVLEGEVIIGGERVRAGAYHLAPRGVDHVPIRTELGATLFLRGAVPSGRDINLWQTAKAAVGLA